MFGITPFGMFHTVICAHRMGGGLYGTGEVP